MANKTNYTGKHQNVQRAIDRAARKQASRAFVEWPGDAGMQLMFLGDATDMVRVRVLVKHGRLKEAFKKAWEMDTAARDHLPESFWKLHYRVVG